MTEINDDDLPGGYRHRQEIKALYWQCHHDRHTSHDLIEPPTCHHCQPATSVAHGSRAFFFGAAVVRPGRLSPVRDSGKEDSVAPATNYRSHKRTAESTGRGPSNRVTRLAPTLAPNAHPPRLETCRTTHVLTILQPPLLANNATVGRCVSSPVLSETTSPGRVVRLRATQAARAA